MNGRIRIGHVEASIKHWYMLKLWGFEHHFEAYDFLYMRKIIIGPWPACVDDKNW